MELYIKSCGRKNYIYLHDEINDNHVFSLIKDNVIDNESWQELPPIKI